MPAFKTKIIIYDWAIRTCTVHGSICRRTSFNNIPEIINLPFVHSKHATFPSQLVVARPILLLLYSYYTIVLLNALAFSSAVYVYIFRHKVCVYRRSPSIQAGFESYMSQCHSGSGAYSHDDSIESNGQ